MAVGIIPHQTLKFPLKLNPFTPLQATAVWENAKPQERNPFGDWSGLGMWMNRQAKPGQALGNGRMPPPQFFFVVTKQQKVIHKA